jgi:CyaY protein
MRESEFEQRVTTTLEALEEALDPWLDDLDYENTGGILTLEFESGGTMVFSRQIGNFQLWVAARSGGYHFNFDEQAGDWRGTRSGELFRDFVVAEIEKQGGVRIELD